MQNVEGICNVVLQISHIGNHQVDSQHVIRRKGKTAVHNHDTVLILKGSNVHANLLQSPQGTNHSIVDAAALAIYSPAGTVVHTGDFKVDYTPVFGDAIDLQRFAELGKKGVLALMCDSTNAERPGFTPSERTVGTTFDGLFEEHKNTRIFVATFASNVDRVQQIINTAYKFGRKVCVDGRSMVSIIDTARNLGCINIPDNTLIEVEQLKNYPVPAGE